MGRPFVFSRFGWLLFFSSLEEITTARGTNRKRGESQGARPHRSQTDRPTYSTDRRTPKHGKRGTASTHAPTQGGGDGDEASRKLKTSSNNNKGEEEKKKKRKKENRRKGNEAKPTWKLHNKT